MAQKLDSKEIVNLEEVVLSGVIQSEAPVNLLDRKGIITKEKLLEEIKRVKAQVAKVETWE